MKYRLTTIANIDPIIAIARLFTPNIIKRPENKKIINTIVITIINTLPVENHVGIFNRNPIPYKNGVANENKYVAKSVTIPPIMQKTFPAPIILHFYFCLYFNFYY